MNGWTVLAIFIICITIDSMWGNYFNHKDNIVLKKYIEKKNKDNE